MSHKSERIQNFRTNSKLRMSPKQENKQVSMSYKSKRIQNCNSSVSKPKHEQRKLQSVTTKRTIHIVQELTKTTVKSK